MTVRSPRRVLRVLLKVFAWGTAALLLFIAAIYLFVIQPFGGGIAAELRLEDGTEYRLVQRYQEWREPYNVDFWERKPGEEWARNYIDHQAMVWKEVEIKHDPEADQIIVTKRGERHAVLNRSDRTFWFRGKYNNHLRPAATANEELD